MKRFGLAAFGAAVLGLSCVTPAAADVVVYQVTDTDGVDGISSPGGTFFGPGIYDFEFTSDKLVGLDFYSSMSIHYDYWIAPPSGSHDDVIYGHQSDVSLPVQAPGFTTYFKTSIVLPEPITEYFVSSGAPGSLAPAGTLLYYEYRWESVTGRFNVYDNSSEPFEFTVTVTKRDLQAPVPEPATWALMIAGFGVAGAGLRRRRAATA